MEAVQQDTTSVGAAEFITSQAAYNANMPQMAMRTHPPVQAGKGMDTALPAGHLDVDFEADMMELAVFLATEPKVEAKIWQGADSLQNSGNTGPPGAR